VIGAAIIRQPKAYPVYDGEYREALDVLEEWLMSLENFQTVGRNGLHRYNNQDHSMLSAMYAARNILGEKNDVWNCQCRTVLSRRIRSEKRPQLTGDGRRVGNSSFERRKF
jgi:hypothetical protein